MSQDVLEALKEPAERLAAARSCTYGLFVGALAYPDALLLETIRSGDLTEGLRNVLAEIDPSLVEGGDWEALSDAGGEDELAVEYSRLFDVGTPAPPCPLYGGLYGGARMKTMEEAIRFFNHFGLTLSEEQRELPDHLATELEFLHFLTFREAEALQQQADPGPFRRAQRDFIERHPGSWVPKLASRLEKQQPMRFFAELIGRLQRFLAHEQRYLTGLVGPAPRDAPRRG
jgi:DMSO reductase family type II enzyme chaperone